MPDSQNRFITNSLSELELDYNPIFGCLSVPLMSLEEAVQNIEEIPDIMAHVATAKEKCTKNAKLKINESAAVYLYTMETNFYAIINKKLRYENRSDLERWFPYLKLLITALSKLPAYVGTVWRGVRDEVAPGFVPGTEHIWWSVNSCSRHKDLARGFICERGILFHIESVDGRDITKYSANQDEDEVVLLPGTHLRFKGIISEGDVLTIQLEQR